MDDLREPAPLVALVDDEPAVTDALEFLLDSVRIHSRTFRSGFEFLDAIPDIRRPLCAVVDLRMPEMSGLELQRRLRDTGVELPLSFLTAHGDVPAAVEAMRAGAVDFIQKPLNPDLFLATVNAMIRIAKDRYQKNLRREAARAALAMLTRRERQVLLGLLRAQSSKQIAKRLDMNPRTVDVHRANLMRKLAVPNRDQLLRLFGDSTFDELVTPDTGGSEELARLAGTTSGR